MHCNVHLPGGHALHAGASLGDTVHMSVAVAPPYALIVDDSASARAQAKNALEEAAASLGLKLVIDEAASGMEAVRALATNDVCLLVVDLHMPDMTGLEVLSFWRSRPRGEGREYRAVVVSSDVSPRDWERAQQQGARCFLDKPLSAEALATALAGFYASPVAAQTGGTP